MYRGKSEDDVMEQYYKDLEYFTENINKLIKTNVPMIFTKKDKSDFKKETKCHICEKELNEDKVRDHDHFTGKYRGAAHNNCNINFRIEPFKYKIPIFYHNLKGYDGHIIIKAFRKYGTKKRIDAIPQSAEKYLSFTIGNMQFIDTFAFMNFSLDHLVSLLSKTDKENNTNSFNHLSKNMEDAQLLKRKGIYPYEYMDSFDKFNETQLPPIEKFYSKLTEKNISTDDYEYAQKVWKELNIKNLGEWHDLYLKTDVFLLADVFENFRNICNSIYKLDPAHYLTAPALSWDAWQKKTGKHIENLTNIDMYNLFKNNIRGGICTVGSQRITRANNKYMKDYDKSKPSSYNTYIDANNLYGYGMSLPLPSGNYKFVKNTSKFTEEFIMNYNFEQAEKGYYFNVDLECPKELHDYFDDYPLAPESFTPKPSQFMKELSKQIGHKITPCNKLILSLNDKTNYGIFGNLLQLYLELGMKLKKVNQVISFDQSRWLKEYIDFNTNKRIEAKKNKNDSEVDFYKLMNNAVYGKFIENLLNRQALELRRTDTKMQKIINSPLLHNFKILDEGDKDTPGLVAFEKKRRAETVLNRPIAVGSAILDNSKYLMYNFYYNVMKKKYGDKVKLLYTDTDSLILNIETEDIYDDMKDMKQYYDVSKYPKNHEIFKGLTDQQIDEWNMNSGVIGLFKDELDGRIMNSFIGLKPKMYSVIYDHNGKEMHKSTAKGVPKHIKEKITHQDFINTIENKVSIKDMKREFKSLRSKNHQINTVNIEKITLTTLDDKRYYLNENESRAHGHYLNN